MTDRRIVIYGNSGSGKTTMARAVADELGIVHFDLDSITWDEPGVRKDLAASVALLHEFTASHASWVIEGCYGELIRAGLPLRTELRFLNPGIAACIAHCHARPWEPHKHPTPEAQNAMLERLIAWVVQYEVREDEYGLDHHRRVFEEFAGPKHEYR